MQPTSILTINGRIDVWRVRWHCREEGSETPADRWLDEAEATISEGVREMACRLNQDSGSFKKTAANLARAAHWSIGKEALRQLVEREGKLVLRAGQRAELQPEWTAEDCRTETGVSRLYLGCDGVQVPLVTEVEKQKRRTKIREKRRRRGRRCLPLPRATAGADQTYKEFKVANFYDETMTHRYVGVTSGNHEAAGRLMQRMACQLELSKAQEKVANVDGAPWIRNQIEFHGLVDAIGLDFYHLRENVQKSRRIVFGEESVQGQGMAGGSDAHVSARGLRCRLGATGRLAFSLAIAGQTKGSQPPAALCGGAKSDDPIPGVPPSRLADWQRAYGKRVQNHHATGQRTRPPLEWSQRRSDDGPRLPGRQPHVANLLDNSNARKELSAAR